MRLFFPSAALALTVFALASAEAADAPRARKTRATDTPAKTDVDSAGVAASSDGATAPAGTTTVTWWGHAAFVITTPVGAVIAIDPWFDNPSAPKGATPPAALDAILVSHGHADHVGGAAALAKRTAANLIAANELSGLIGAEHTSAMTPGGSIKIKDATIHLVEAVHSSGYDVDRKNVRYGGAPVGFIITIDNGPTLYHAGDTDVFSSMELIAQRYKPSVAMLPIGGHYTMGPDGAALSAKLLKVKTIIPMHFGTFPVLAGTPAELRAELKSQKVTAKVLELKPGETTKL